MCQADPFVMDWHGSCDGGTCLGGLRDGDSCTIDDDCAKDVHVFGADIVPGSSQDETKYEIQEIVVGCNQSPAFDNYSPALEIKNSRWGDIVLDCAVNPCPAPDGSVDLVTDVTGVLNKFQNLTPSPSKARADVEPEVPDFEVNISDVIFVLNAFGGDPYPFSDPVPCPPS